MNSITTSWSKKNLEPVDRQQARASVSEIRSGFDEVLQRQQSMPSSGPDFAAKNRKILVGEVTSQTPTVSELLIQNKELNDSAWNILSSPQNRDREYTKIIPGTPVYYDPVTKQLSWPTRTPDKAQSSHHQTAGAGSSLTAENLGQITVGVLSAEFPTVSHLLESHSQLSSDMWNILAEGVNREARFTDLPPGAKIIYNPENNKISWELPAGKLSGEAVADQQKMAAEPILVSGNGNEGVGQEGQQPIFLGRIGEDGNSTVSHLLQQHEQFGARMWQLLSSEVNRHKPFHQIASGAEIYIDPKTSEISWKNGTRMLPDIVAEHVDPETIPPVPAIDLTEAVKPLMGKHYNDINCYELLVEGLQRMDIPYGGRGGLYSRLVKMAREDGLSVNAYLNGEGIVKAAGSTLMARTVVASDNWQEDAERFYRELEPLLGKGQILSFSTRNRGHTGIISRQDEQWTFINSGRLDNSLTGNTPSRGVGEEVLEHEIRNWFKLARNRKQDLSITLGQLDHGKIVASSSDNRKLSTRI